MSRFETLRSAGITEDDALFASTRYVGKSRVPESCSLCGTIIYHLFALEFPHVDFCPVGCVCIEKWIESLPKSKQRARLTRSLDGLKRKRGREKRWHAKIDAAIRNCPTANSKLLFRRLRNLDVDIGQDRDEDLGDIARRALRVGDFQTLKQARYFAVLLREAGA